MNVTLPFNVQYSSDYSMCDYRTFWFIQYNPHAHNCILFWSFPLLLVCHCVTSCIGTASPVPTRHKQVLCSSFPPFISPPPMSVCLTHSHMHTSSIQLSFLLYSLISMQIIRLHLRQVWGYSNLPTVE